MKCIEFVWMTESEGARHMETCQRETDAVIYIDGDAFPMCRFHRQLFAAGLIRNRVKFEEKKIPYGNLHSPELFIPRGGALML